MDTKLELIQKIHGLYDHGYGLYGKQASMNDSIEELKYEYFRLSNERQKLIFDYNVKKFNEFILLGLDYLYNTLNVSIYDELNILYNSNNYSLIIMIFKKFEK